MEKLERYKLIEHLTEDLTEQASKIVEEKLSKEIWTTEDFFVASSIVDYGRMLGSEHVGKIKKYMTFVTRVHLELDNMKKYGIYEKRS